MDTNFRMKYCRFCNNNKLDLKTGVQCGLELTPEIINDHCTDFSYNKKERKRINRIRKKSKVEEDKKSSIGFWHLSSFLVPFIVGAIVFYKTQQLDEEYRWTIGTTYEKSIGYSLLDKFTLDSYLYYSYKVNGLLYQGETKVNNENFDVNNYFVRYNPNNPENSEIDHFKMIPYYINLNDVPPNGISSDSIKYFVKAQLEKRKQKNNLP